MRPEPDIVFGQYRLRIRKDKTGYIGIVVGRSNERFSGSTREEVEELLKKSAASQNKGFFGLTGAKERFLKCFPDGFEDETYVSSGDYGERGYKLDTSVRVNEQLPFSNLDGVDELGETALRLFRSINLVDPFTKAKMASVLRGPKAKRFMEISREFAEGSISNACSYLNREFSDEDVNKWTCITFFPFFWKPKEHFFLKPEFVKEFAERIGDKFQYEYESRPNPETYKSLLRMISYVKDNIPEMNPRDNIDIHSFMFATVSYTDNDIAKLRDIHEAK